MADVPRRPFWTVAHRCNLISDVNAALRVRANGLQVNAIECDISVDPAGQLIVAHDALLIANELSDGTLETVDAQGLTRFGTRIDEFFNGIRSLALDFPAFALIYLDCKVGTAELGEALARKVGEYLNITRLAVVYSHASRDGAAQPGGVLRAIPPYLQPGHGIMVDEDGPPAVVVDALAALGTDRIGYGDGIDMLLPSPAGLYPRLLSAVDLRARTGTPRFIGSWTYANEATMRTVIGAGVDAILVTKGSLDGLLRIIAELPEVRMANRGDDPFRKPAPGFTVEIDTVDRTWAGTDAPLLVTVEGSGGSVSRIVTTGRIGLTNPAEAGGTLGVPFQGALPAVGSPQEVRLTMLNDSGADPRWQIERVTLHRGPSQPVLVGYHPDWIVPSTETHDSTARVAIGDRVYEWRVTTTAEHGGGTDAGITFTLDGTEGTLRFLIYGSQRLPATPYSAAKEIDWFEAGFTNTFHLVGPDIGQITGLSVSNDGNTVASAWSLGTVTVSTPGGLAPLTFSFQRVVDDGDTVQGSLLPG